MLSSKLYDTLVDLFDVGDDLIVHVDHIVLKVRPKANLAPFSERLWTV